MSQLGYIRTDRGAITYADPALTPDILLQIRKLEASTGKNAMPARVGVTMLIVHPQLIAAPCMDVVGGHGVYVWQSG